MVNTISICLYYGKDKMSFHTLVPCVFSYNRINGMHYTHA
jgi:hypothetical protein